ncbi:DUF418 domain-containing protein [Novosphingobium sp. AAP93]|uniref:DUF418 domain-containing protein n=1 Tax=Novosphingobium sp. AAP93 TaxID=1523427 RepID=UPI0006B9BD6E|nr:DUF418 domain-containing protein [Novosphingobium sp. AAP93]KPF87561.1 hypothetical protein IP83_07210 [Novosphingobium sp. AAP93]
MPERIGALDFVRGVAVLGILAINVTGLWGPLLATFSPAMPSLEPGGAVWFAAAYVLFEGKMRGLFTLLFGASMMLFADAAERRGSNPDLMQVRRLLLLMAFGYAHFALLWWGDILLPYAVCGMLAFSLRRLAPEPLAAAALLLFLASHGLEMVGDLASIAAENRVLAGHGAPAEVADQAAMMGRIAASITADMQVLHASFLDAVRIRLTTAPALPLANLGATFFETFPLMLLGMALLRLGLFTGEWEGGSLRRMALFGIGMGGSISAALIGWAATRGFPPAMMFALMGSLAAIPHLAMTLGYLAVLLLLYPRLKDTPVGQRLVAAGRCAFTNYLGTTFVMCALFAGWGLGLGGVLPRGTLPVVVLGGWALMLAWPQWWLARFGQGPLEALWRKLTWLGVPRSPTIPPADGAV